jgi:HK97 family phage portal protein
VFLERFLEQRYTFKYPSDDFYDAWTGGESATVSGERVGPEKALGLSAYFAALRAISEDIAKLPRPLYERLPRGKKRRPDHPVYGLVDGAPNKEMGAMSFWEIMVGHALAYGNGFAEIARAGAVPVALWPLDPTMTRCYRHEDGDLAYEVTYPSDRVRTVKAANVFHLHGFGFDGWTGYSIAQTARASIGSALAARKHGAALFGNASRPGGVVRYPNPIKDPKKWRAAWEDEFKGSFNAHKTAVLDSGAEYTPISVPNKDAQWIEAQNFSIEEIARWFRMPPHKLQHLVYGTYANVDHLAIEYVVDTLASWMKRIEQEIWRKLLSREERKGLFVEHIAEGLLRGDIEKRYKAYAIARQWGWKSANDVLEKENENPLPGDQGDIYMIPANMMDASKINEQPEPVASPVPPDEPERATLRLLLADMVRRLATDASDTGGERLPTPVEVIERTVKAYRPVLRDAYARTLRVECDKVRRATRRPQFSKWLLEFREKHKPHVEDALTASVESLVRVVASTFCEGEPNGEISEHIRGMADRYTRRASSRLWRRQKADIDEYATTEVTEELPKLSELLVGLCTENGNANTKPE